MAGAYKSLILEWLCSAQVLILPIIDAVLKYVIVRALFQMGKVQNRI